MRANIFSTALFAIVSLFATEAQAGPLVEKYLHEGKLAEGEQALVAHLQKVPPDDEARMGLGVVQFLRAFERLGAGLYRHGLRTERAFRGVPAEVREFLPQNTRPEKLTYPRVRELLQGLLDDLAKVETTLAAVKDPAVKLNLHPGLMQVDIFGLGKPVSANIVFGRVEVGAPREEIERFVVAFDRGDVAWLRGYCHLLSAVCEVLLAVDAQELFDCTAHLFFERVESPHAFLQEDERALDGIAMFNRPVFSDVIAFVHLWRFPLREPARMQAALGHLEATLAMAKEMWKFYAAETDDDHEWIPNAKQTGVMQVAVNQEMIDTWLKTVDEVERVLQGKSLVPFWRGQPGERGVNVRRVFTEPRTIDPILWVQGTAATPYLEKGPLTKFSDPQVLRRMNDTFGGVNFFGFAFWFN